MAVWAVHSVLVRYQSLSLVRQRCGDDSGDGKNRKQKTQMSDSSCAAVWNVVTATRSGLCRCRTPLYYRFLLPLPLPHHQHTADLESCLYVNMESYLCADVESYLYADMQSYLYVNMESYLYADMESYLYADMESCL